MSEPKRIGDILVAIAADPKDDFAKVLRQCPDFINASPNFS